MTLIAAINLDGEPFAFHAVAAYLNSLYTPGYAYSQSEVLAIIASGNGTNWLEIKDRLAAANEAGICPLGGGAAST